MKRILTACLCTLIVMVFLTSLSYAGTITSSVTPVTDSANKDQPLSVSVKLDLSGMDESLGSFTATLKWDSQVLKYISYQPGSTSGFTQLVNERQVEKGQLTFGAVNPDGADGIIHILNVVFQVIGSEGSQCDIQLTFTDMMSAKTFHDLLPYMQSVQTGVEHGITVGEQPKEYRIDQNFPNPFNPTTNIQFMLPKMERVRLYIFNTRGECVCSLLDEIVESGLHTQTWNGSDESGRPVPAGIYFLQMKCDSFDKVVKLTYIK